MATSCNVRRCPAAVEILVAADLYLVQRALGHRHIATTEIYARVGDEALRRAVAKI